MEALRNMASSPKAARGRNGSCLLMGLPARNTCRVGTRDTCIRCSQVSQIAVSALPTTSPIRRPTEALWAGCGGGTYEGYLSVQWS